MSESSISVFQDEFSCSICLDLLKNPVTIPCGHSYCMSCITDCWNQYDEKRVSRCPQCRQTFTPRPALGKNVMLAEMVEKLKTKLQTGGSAPSYAGPEDVECDVCTGRKHKAVKSCLMCLESYCQSHFKRHEELHSGKRHKVTEATGRLQKMICPKHDTQLEVYCRTDNQCICYPCIMDEHKNHDTVAAKEGRREKQMILVVAQKQFQQRIQEKEKKLQHLREAVKTHKHSARAAELDTERIFTELIRSIERRRSEVIKLIRDQEKTAVSRAEGVLKELEQEIEDLRRRHEEMEQLLHTEDHIRFLQSFQSLSAPPETTVNITVSSCLSFDNVGILVSYLKEDVENFCKEEIEKISGNVSYIEIILNKPKTRMELLQCCGYKEDNVKHFVKECLLISDSHLLSLDPNTSHKNIILSKRNTVANKTNTVQQYPDHPYRFSYWSQVLCRERVCRRCYWEVEWRKDVDIAVSYKSISRKGNTEKCVFGYNDESWSLFCSPLKCSFWHNDKEIKLPVVSSSRIGVYVDHSAGILSFYSVSYTMTLIHRVHTTFTQPLYPGFGLDENSTVKLCHTNKEHI